LLSFLPNQLIALKRRGIVIVKPSNLASSRREFLLNVLPAGSLFCLGCGNFSGWTAVQDAQKAAEQKPKFLEDSGWSFQDIFDFAFKDFYIPTLKGFAQDIKNIDLIKTLKNIADRQSKIGGREYAEKLQKNDFATFAASRKESHVDPFWSHVQDVTYIEDSGKALEYKITTCLAAKTFRKVEASDIGYAYLCYGDDGFAAGFNPKIRLIRPKTLMQGDDCCNFRWVWEG
jgi:predicted hydrocarbon binding protein